jgi:hypothetical protein
MIRTEKRWALSCIRTNPSAPLVIWRIFDTKGDALDERDPGQDLMAVTVTYDDGKPKKRPRARK